MIKEFNLSEKIKNLFEVEYLDSMADVQGDVTVLLKEFIKRLHKIAAYGFQGRDLIEEIDKLAGDKLK